MSRCVICNHTAQRILPVIKSKLPINIGKVNFQNFRRTKKVFTEHREKLCRAGCSIRATAYKSSRKYDFSAVVIVPSGFATFFSEAQSRWLTFKQVHTKVTNTGHDRRAISFTYAAGVVTQHDIQSPVQRIFDAPMSTYRMGEGFSLRRNRVDEIAPLYAVRSALQSLAFHHADAA